MFNFKQMLSGYAERDMEIKDARDEFARNLSLKNRSYLFETGITKLENIKQRRSERLSKIELAGTYNLSQEAALMLDASGQLDSTLTYLEKLDPKDLNKNNIKILSETILNQYPEELRSKVLTNSILLGTNFNPEEIQERLTRAAFDANTSVEEIEKIFSEIPEQKRISVKPAEVAFRAAESVPLEELNLLNVQISKTLDGLIGTWNAEKSNWIWDDSPEGQRVYQELVGIYTNARTTPDFTGSPTVPLDAAMKEVSKAIRSGVQLSEIQVGTTDENSDFQYVTIKKNNGLNKNIDSGEENFSSCRAKGMYYNPQTGTCVPDINDIPPSAQEQQIIEEVFE